MRARINGPFIGGIIGRATNLEIIEQIKIDDREAIQSLVSNPIHATSHVENHVGSLKRELIELINILFEMEHQLTYMKSPCVYELLDADAQCKSFINHQSTRSQE